MEPKPFAEKWLTWEIQGPDAASNTLYHWWWWAYFRGRDARIIAAQKEYDDA